MLKFKHTLFEKKKTQQRCVQKYVLMCTEVYHVVLCMVNSLKKNAQYVLCVPLMIFLWLLVEYKHVKSLCYFRPLYQNFIRNNTLQLCINWYFMCHMCVIWVHKTLKNSATGPLNAETNITTSYDIIIMVKQLHPVLYR